MAEQVKYRFCKDCPDYWECGRGFDLRKGRRHCGKATLPSHKKIVTNATRIRTMSDEELAGWLDRIRLCCSTDLCGRNCPFAEVCYSSAEAPKETLDWLKQEAE